MDIRMVQIHLGHRSLRTTQRYTHVSQHEVAEVVRSRIGEIFQGSEKMIESVQMDESGPGSHGAARIRDFLAEFRTLIQHLKFGGVFHAITQ